MIDLTDVSVLLDNEALYDICRRGLEVERPINVDLYEYEKNLVPYPRLHFAVASYSPIIAADKSEDSLSVEAITHAVFQPQHFFAKCDPRNGKYLSCFLAYRGDVVTKDIHKA